MKVIQINTKSKSPKNDLNIINRILNVKPKNSTKNIKSKKTRNIDFSTNNSKKKYISKRILPYNNCIHFSSNNCSSTNTTNFNNSKTNNFIFFENDFNIKDTENLKQQINSIIKHNSLNNFLNNNTNISNIKFINNKYKQEKEIRYKIRDNERNINIDKNSSNEDNNKTDIVLHNKNDKLYFNSNYSCLLNNTKKEKLKEKGIFTKIQNFKNCFRLYNSRPLSLNFSNEFNNYNSYKMLLNNKSMKYLNKYKPNYGKKSGNENLSKIKKKGNSENKDSKKKALLSDNLKIKGSKSYNILFIHKRNKLSNSSSFSPVNSNKNKKIETKKKNANLKKNNNKSSLGMKNNISVERVQINLYNKKNNNNNINKSGRKYSSLKTSENQINKQYFNRIDYKKIKGSNDKKNIIISKKTNYINYKKGIHRNDISKKIKNIENTIIYTPEENHYLAIKQIQQIKKNNNIFK